MNKPELTHSVEFIRSYLIGKVKVYELIPELKDQAFIWNEILKIIDYVEVNHIL